jgi:hypothetical protein
MPRKRPRTEVADHVPIETWSLVALYLSESPRKVFMLLCSIKGLKLDDEWWEALWKRLKPQVRNGKLIFNFVKLYELRRPCQYKVVFRLIYGMFCNQCGCRFHHNVFDAYNMRLCHNCLRDHHVSNVVLWKDYGINLEDIGRDYRLFLRYISLKSYSKAKHLSRFTRDPRDFAVRTLSKIAFFWLPDLRRFFDLDALALEHRRRLRALSLIKAAFKRTYVASVGRRYFFETIQDNELKRVLAPTTATPFTYGTNGLLCNVLKPGRNREPEEPDFNIYAAFHRQPAMSILGDKEYTVRTMAHRLNLNKSGVVRKFGELVASKGSVAECLGVVFQI